MPVPESPTRTNAVDDPLICALFLGKRAWTPKTLPVRRWHAKQWQTETRIGSTAVTTVSCPQLHDAVRTVIAPPRVIVTPHVAAPPPAEPVGCSGGFCLCPGQSVPQT